MRLRSQLLVVIGVVWVVSAVWLLGGGDDKVTTTPEMVTAGISPLSTLPLGLATRVVPAVPRPTPLSGGSPNGVILYLQGGRWDRQFTAHALPSLQAYVLGCLPHTYPIHVFTEVIPSKQHQSSMRALVPSARSLEFEDVSPIWATLPHGVSEASLKGWMAERPGFQGRGYRIMCRFWAGLVWGLASMDKYEYYWRLDTDSVFLSPILVDPFEGMVQQGCEYGYNRIKGENPHVSMGLFEAYEAWVRRETQTGSTDFMSPQEAKVIRGLFVDRASGVYNRTMFYNNFELGTFALKRSRVYQSLFSFLDSRPPYGIFQYRWGDAPIHTLGVMAALHGNWSKTCFYPRSEVNYRHAMKRPPAITGACKPSQAP